MWGLRGGGFGWFFLGFLNAFIDIKNVTNCFLTKMIKTQISKLYGPDVSILARPFSKAKIPFCLRAKFETSGPLYKYKPCIFSCLGQSEPTTVSLYQHKEWPSDQETPSSFQAMLAFMQLTLPHHEEKEPIVVHCM